MRSHDGILRSSYWLFQLSTTTGRRALHNPFNHWSRLFNAQDPAVGGRFRPPMVFQSAFRGPEHAQPTNLYALIQWIEIAPPCLHIVTLLTGTSGLA